MKVQITSDYKNGKFSRYVSDVMRGFFARLEGKRCLITVDEVAGVITIERQKKHRSSQQNRFYWGVVIPIVCTGLNDTGYQMDADDTHDLLKLKFLKVEHINEETGEILPSIGSTAKLTTTDFMAYIAAIQQWAAEFLNVTIPDPGEQMEAEFNNH